MNNVNKERELIAPAIAALRDLGVDVNRERDGSLIIRRDGKRIRYSVEVRAAVTRAVLGALTLQLQRQRQRPLLITEQVTPPIADELRARHIEFVDAAGNAFLDRRGLLVITSGRRRAERSTKPRTHRVFSRVGLKVAFVVISAPEILEQTQRSLSRAAGVALGSVSVVMEGLRELGFVAEVRGRRRLLSRDRLIDQWTEAYARQLAPQLEIGRFTPLVSDWWRHADLTKYHAAWGGETAAALLRHHLVPELAIVYREELSPALVIENKLIADRNGTVIFRRRFWNDVASPRADVVPPLLVYSDLVAAGDARSLEAAKQIRDAYLV